MNRQRMIQRVANRKLREAGKIKDFFKDMFSEDLDEEEVVTRDLLESRKPDFKVGDLNLMPISSVPSSFKISDGKIFINPRSKKKYVVVLDEGSGILRNTYFVNSDMLSVNTKISKNLKTLMEKRGLKAFLKDSYMREKIERKGLGSFLM